MKDYPRTRPPKSKQLPSSMKINRLDATVLWYVECHARLGATDTQIAEMLCVNVNVVDYWKKHRPEFKAALKRGKKTPDDMVEHSLLERAIGYSHPDVHITQYKGQVIKVPYIKHYPPDTAACIVWLRNRRREEWSDTMLHRHEHTGTINHKKIEDIPIDELTPQQQKLLFELNMRQIEDGSSNN